MKLNITNLKKLLINNIDLISILLIIILICGLLLINNETKILNTIKTAKHSNNKIENFNDVVSLVSYKEEKKNNTFNIKQLKNDFETKNENIKKYFTKENKDRKDYILENFIKTETTQNPSTTQPSDEQSSTTQPSTTQPSTTQPSTTQPSKEQPNIITDKQFLDEYILNLTKYNINLELINLFDDCINFINVPRNQINCITSEYEEENINKCVITNNTRFVYKETNEGTLYLLIIKKLEWLNNRLFNLEDDKILINYMDKELRQRIMTFINNILNELYNNYNLYDIENNSIKNFSIKK